MERHEGNISPLGKRGRSFPLIPKVLWEGWSLRFISTDIQLSEYQADTYWMLFSSMEMRSAGKPQPAPTPLVGQNLRSSARLSCWSVFSSVKRTGSCAPGYLFLCLLKCWSDGVWGKKKHTTNQTPKITTNTIVFLLKGESALYRHGNRVRADEAMQRWNPSPHPSEMKDKPDLAKPRPETSPACSVHHRSLGKSLGLLDLSSYEQREVFTSL